MTDQPHIAGKRGKLGWIRKDCLGIDSWKALIALENVPISQKPRVGEAQPKFARKVARSLPKSAHQ